MREVSRGAFFDVRKLLDAEGHPLPLEQLDDEIASAVAGVELATEHRGEVHTTIRRYKLADRRAWVDMGLKVLGGYKQDHEQSNPGNALVALLRDMRRSSLPVVQQVDDDQGV